MLSLFASLKGLLKSRTTCTDGPVFRLHSRWTVIFLLSSSLLLTCRQYFGDPIHCIQRDVSRLRALETFCWTHATFVLPDAWNATVGVEVPHPGIDTHVPGQRKIYHGYYQWVSLVLLLQGILFYIPRHLWKAWERGTMRALTLDLDDPLLPQENADKSCQLLANSLRLHWGHHASYLQQYMFCEFLSLVNVIGQMLLLDQFLGGTFTTFGIKVIQWSEWDQEYRTDPMVRVFPRMTKCQFHDHGSSGDVQKVDALCILPLNVLNEKIFIFLWFWMMILCGLTSLVILYRLILAAVPTFRYCALVPRAPRANKGALDKLLNKAHMGDWFVLYLLAKNIEPLHFRAVVSKLAASMELNGHLSVPSSSYMENGKLAYV